MLLLIILFINVIGVFLQFAKVQQQLKNSTIITNTGNYNNYKKYAGAGLKVKKIPAVPSVEASSQQTGRPEGR